MTSTLPKPTNTRWTIFALACSTSWLLYLHRYAFALMKPQIAEQWQLGETDLGLLDSMFFLCYTLFQIPLGVAVDVWGVRLVLTELLLVGSLGLGMHAWAATYGQLLCARAVLGVGQSAVYAALNRVSRLWFPPTIRTTLQGFVAVLSGRIGGLSANLLFASLLIGVLQLDWRVATQIFVVIGVVQAILFYALFRNTPTEHARVNQAEAALIAGVPQNDLPEVPIQAAPPRTTLRELVRNLTPRGCANLAALVVQTGLSTFADTLYSNWIPLFLWKVHHLADQERGVYSSLPLLGGAIAGVLGGVLNDLCIAWTGNRRWSRSGVAAVGKGLAAVWLGVALWYYDQPYVFCGLLFLVKFFGDWSITTTWGVAADIGGQATATVFAVNNAIAGLGSIAAPVVFGYLAEHYGWQVVFLMVIVIYVLCAISWLFVNCTIPLGRERKS